MIQPPLLLMRGLPFSCKRTIILVRKEARKTLTFGHAHLLRTSLRTHFEKPRKSRVSPHHASHHITSCFEPTVCTKPKSIVYVDIVDHVEFVDMV